jgi:hypothetical protein
MQEFWMITLHYGEGNFSTISIDEHPAEWLIKWGNHRKPPIEKHIVFAMQITKEQYEKLDELRP